MNTLKYSLNISIVVALFVLMGYSDNLPQTGDFGNLFIFFILSIALILFRIKIENYKIK